MIVNAYVVVDPAGDRPYITTKEPVSLDRKNGSIKVFHYILHVPNETVMENTLTFLTPEPEAPPNDAR